MTTWKDFLLTTATSKNPKHPTELDVQRSECEEKPEEASAAQSTEPTPQLLPTTTKDTHV